MHLILSVYNNNLISQDLPYFAYPNSSIILCKVSAHFATPHPGVGVGSEKPYPGKLGTTTWYAYNALSWVAFPDPVIIDKTYLNAITTISERLNDFVKFIECRWPSM